MAMNLKKVAALAGVAGILILGISGLVGGFSLGFKPSYIDPSNQKLVTKGKQVYEANCASCHGRRLEGEPNWQLRKANGRLPAPPHDETGHTWHHPDSVLFDITKNGLVPGVTAPPGYTSDMPAYKNLLSDDEIRASLAYIKSHWPKQALARQKAITQRQ